jgi:hypothetical protein
MNERPNSLLLEQCISLTNQILVAYQEHPPANFILKYASLRGGMV